MLAVRKILSTALISLVVLAVLIVIAIGVFLNRIVKTTVETYGPRLTQTSVTLDSVHLSLLTGSANITGLVVGNPKGYQTPNAISVGTIAVGVNPLSIFSKKVVIRSLRLEAPEINFEGGFGGNNLSRILDNVDSAGNTGAPPASPAPAEAKPEKRYQVDDLLVTGAKVEVILTGMAQPEVVTLPDIHLTDLGEGADGITAKDLARRILSSINAATLEAVAADAIKLGKNAATLKQAGENAGKQIGNVLLQNAVSNLFKK